MSLVSEYNGTRVVLARVQDGTRCSTKFRWCRDEALPPYRDSVLGKGSSTPNICVACVRNVDDCTRETRLVEEGDIGEFRRNVSPVRRAL